MSKVKRSISDGEALVKENALLTAINRAHEHLITEAKPQQLFDSLLSDFLELTDSEYGFIAQILYKLDGTPYIKTHAFTNLTWDDVSWKFYEENMPEGLEFTNLNNLFGQVVTTGEAVLSNNPANDPRSGGMLKGQPPLTKFLGLPVYFGEKLIGEICLANCSNGYDQSTVEFLQPLLKTVAQIIEVYKSNQHRQESEQLLRESHAQFKEISENIQDVLWMFSPDFSETLYVSSAYETVWGRRCEELYQNPMDWQNTIHPDDVARVIKKLEQVTDKIVIEYRIIHPDKSIHWIRNRAFPIKDDSGQIYRIGGIAQDITNQKTTEVALLKTRDDLKERVKERTQNLAEVNKLLEGTFSSMGEAILVINPKTRDILSCNPVVEKIFGYSRDEVIGENAELFHVNHESYRLFGKKMFSALEQSGVFKMEFDLKRKNGAIFPVENTITQVKNELGEVIALVNVARDISDRKESEKTIKKQMRHLDAIDRISRLSLQSDFDVMLESVLEEMLYIFPCDRAWVLFPCDPKAEVCRIPMERTRTKWPGPFELKVDLPILPGMAEMFETALDDGGVICYDPNSPLKLQEASEEFSIRSQLVIALHVKGSPPWLLGIHHCEEAHIYTEEEQSIFYDISQRVRDGLINLLAMQDLKKSRTSLAEAQHIAKLGTCRIDMLSNVMTWSNEVYRILGFEPQSCEATIERFLETVHPEDRDFFKEAHEEAFQSKSPSDIVHRLQLKDGTIKYIHEIFEIQFDDEGSPIRTVGTIQDITDRVRAEEALKLYKFSLEQAPESIFFMTPDAGFSYVNIKACESLGYTSGELLAMKLWDIDPTFPKKRGEEIITGQEETIHTETFHRRKDGVTFPVEVWAKHLWIGDTEFHVAFVRDISTRKKSEKELRLMAAVFENTAEAVMVTNPDNKIIAINQAFTDITGYTETDVFGKDPKILKSEKHDRGFYQSLWAGIETADLWQGELWDRRKNGEIFPAWSTITAVRDQDQKLTNYVSVFSDISTIKRSQEQLNFLAHHDPLTELPNRILFNDRLEHALIRAQREKKCAAILFLDLDRFKNINDSLGHPVGDVLLKKAASRISEMVRKEDTVARLGGDEFIVLIEEIEGAKEAAFLAEKVLSAFNKPFVIKERELHLTVSVGISLYPQDGVDSATLVKNADAAMYRAKEEGRNDYEFYTTALTTAVFERLTMENALRHALDNNELVLYYQPQHSLKTGKIIGAEALIRWRHPEMGLIAPTKFIPLAEESGLIVSIGKWVMRVASRQMQDWLDVGFTLRHMAVNVSGVQVQRGEFVDTVRDVLEETGLDPKRLELEITETFVMQKTDWAISVLDKLKLLGVRMAIDDFGTGYSSLSYLKRLPIDKLKIDGSFVRDIAQDTDDEAIVRTIIVLGQTLQLNVNAEGVETEEQKIFLKSLGCDEVQGYLYSKPLPSKEFEKLLEAQYPVH